MTDFPNAPRGYGPSITFADGCYHDGGLFALAMGSVYNRNNTFSNAMDVANKALLYPFMPHSDFTCRRMGVLNGGTVSGNFDLGIYDIKGNRLSSIGSTAQATTGVVQSVALSAAVTMKAFVTYLLAVVFDNTTGTTRSMCPGGISIPPGELGLMEAAASFALPSSLTPVKALTTTKKLPRLHLSERTVL